MVEARDGGALSQIGSFGQFCCGRKTFVRNFNQIFTLVLNQFFSSLVITVGKL